MATRNPSFLDLDYSRYNFRDNIEYVYRTPKGLTRAIVAEISAIKGEPEWMRDFRLRAYEIFIRKPLPTWGADLSGVNFDEYTYYLRPTDRKGRSWDEVPEEIRRTFERLGIPEAERKFLAGVGAQYESEVVYHHIREDLAKKGVIFVDTDTAVREYPDLVRPYFGTVVPPEDNKFAALNSAVWSGGCLTAEARVFTANPGIKSIAEVREGDTVFALSPDGKLVPARVIAHIYSGRKPVYRIQVAGRTLEATGNHMFLALEKSPTPLNRWGRRWVLRWKPLEELQVGDVIAIAKRIPTSGQSKVLPPLPSYLKNHHHRRTLRAPEKTNPDLMWLLGLWVGDGHIHSPHPHMGFINFAIPEGDPVRAEAIRLFKELFNYTVKTQNRVSFTVNSKAISEWFRQLGFVGTAKTKRIPEWVFGLPWEEKLAFLGGLLDADGWVENEGKAVVFELANRPLIEDIKLLAISCGLFSDGQVRMRHRSSVLRKGNDRQIVSGDTYACRITGRVALIGTRSPRWRARLDQARKRTLDKYTTVTGENLSCLSTEDVGWAPIRKKEYVGIKDVYDIQVEGLANFVANGIIAHNSFVYVPAGVRVDIPLQAYFRINAENVGQFERTLIIAEEGSYVHYIEGCTAPIYSKDSLHSAVVEIIAKRGAHVRYTTIQNWSKNVYNLVTKRAVAYEDATVEWIDGNMGCLTGDAMVYKNNDVVPIRDIQVGDFVWSLTPDFQLVRSRVVAKKVNPPRPVYRLTLANRREVRATDNHPFLVLRRVGSVQVLRWLPLAEIRPGDRVAIVGRLPDAGRPYRLELAPTGRGPKALRFPEFTDERLMWLLGFYTAGGSTDRSQVSFTVAEDDPAASEVRRLLKELFGVEATRRGATLRVDSAELVEFFHRIGFAGTAPTKRIPAWVFTLPEAQKRAFIEGYIAAGGRARRGSARVSITAPDRDLLEQIRHLAISCGLNPTKISPSVRRGKETRTHGAYVLDFSDESLGDAPVYFARVVSVQPAGEEVTYDIEVEGTANFIANGIFAHNSKVTMKYPCVYLLGKGAKAEILSVAYAGAGQHQDSGGKVIHGAPYTTSTITSKSISKDGGRTTYRGLVKVPKGSVGVKVNVRCDALILDEKSRSDTYPYMEIEEERVTIAHEATVGKISDDQIFYLMSRGLTEAEALALIVLGFIEPFAKVLPMEYAIELNRLIQLEMEGAVG